MDDNNEKIYQQYDTTIANLLVDVVGYAHDTNGINVCDFDLDCTDDKLLLQIIYLAQILYHINVRYKCNYATKKALKKLYPDISIKTTFFKHYNKDFSIESTISEEQTQYYSDIYNAYYRKDK